MATARSADGCALHWIEKGSGDAILLIHGFASTLRRNWQGTGWIDALARAGWRAIAYDQRGHGESEKRYDANDYAPERLVEDTVAVLEAAGVEHAVVMGYSMGARIAVDLAITRPEAVRALVLSGIGANFREFGGTHADRELVAAAIEAEDPSGFPSFARFYRTFADQSGADRRALAACWRRPIQRLEIAELIRIRVPTLFAVGDRDGVAGDPEPLARAMPNARVVRIAGKNHMNAVGAKEHRTAVIEFLATLTD
jgi:pimeloyl-ACP methyl ester carboxylesterase